MNRFTTMVLATLLATIAAPAHAGVCPPDLAAARQLVAGQRHLKDSTDCEYECTSSSDYDGAGLSVFGAEPQRVELRNGDELEFVLPGGVERYTDAFRQAYVGRKRPRGSRGECHDSDFHGPSCEWDVDDDRRDNPPGIIERVYMDALFKGDDVTRLSCRYNAA